jgi:surface-anchored protein
LLALTTIMAMVALPTPPAQASGPERTALSGATLPLVSVAAGGVQLTAADVDGRLVDADLTTFEVDGTGRADGRLALVAELGDGAELTGLDVHWSVSAAPPASAVRLSRPGDDQPMAGSGDLHLDRAGAIDLGWSFDQPGDYLIEVTARATVAPGPTAGAEAAEPEDQAGQDDGPAMAASPATADSPAPAFELGPATATYRVVVAATEPDPVAPAEAEPETDQAADPAAAALTGAVPSDSTAAGDGTDGPVGLAGSDGSAGQGNTVLAAGDVRLASRLVDGVLSQSLMVVDTAGGFELYDVGSTVVSIPNSEPWPGEGSPLAAGSKAAWEAWAPEHGAVWRTLSRLNPQSQVVKVNPLTVSFDTGFIPWSGYKQDLDVNQTTVSVTAVSGGDGGTVIVHRGASVLRPASALSLGEKLISSPGMNLPGGFGDVTAYVTAHTGGSVTGVMKQSLGQPVASNGFVFTAAGVYCVSVTTETMAGTGDWLRDSTTYTFAVGQDDPATVQLCAQPDTEDGQEPGPDEPPAEYDFTGAVASGVDVALAARLNEGEFSLGGYVAGQTAAWFDPGATVIDLPIRDESAWPLAELSPAAGLDNKWQAVGQAGEHLFRTNPGKLGYVPAHGNPVQVRPDASFVPAALVGSNVTFELGAVEGPAGGRLTTFDIASSSANLAVPDQEAYWNSADRVWNRDVQVRPGAGAYPGSLDAALGTRGGNGVGLAFNEPGRYCVTLRASVQLRETGEVKQAWQTYTFAVGDDPATVVPCAQRQDGVVSPGDLDAGLLDDVVYLRHGHTDIGTRVVGDRLELYVGDETSGSLRMADPQDVIIVGSGPLVESTVVVDGQVDTSLIGQPGDTYWRFTQGGQMSSWVVWPGLNTLQTGGNGFDRTVDFRILGVDGPGDFVLAQSDAFLADDPKAILYASDPGTPGPFSEPLSKTHIHLNWLFSAPGRYCVNLEAKARDATSAGSQDRVSDLITFVVGDVDLHGVLPCGRPNAGATAVVDPIPEISISPTPTALVADADVVSSLQETALYLDDGRLAVATALVEGAHGATIWRDPERFVFTSSNQYRARRSLSLTAGRLDGRIDGDVELALGQVDGPGWYRVSGAGIAFGSDAEAKGGTLWQGWTVQYFESFETAGVYCVPLTWSATVGGERQSVSRTLTFVINDTAPGQPAYVDPATVRLCADGGQGSAGDPDQVEPPLEWEVPNGFVNDAGATVLNDGHVDIASTLDGRSFASRIKDDSTAAEPVYRDPAQTVLQISPYAQTVAPEDDRYAFLGQPGAALWQVTETQQNDLLWPGWSTEAIPSGALQGGVNWQLTGISGPGEFALYSNGAAEVHFNTRDGVTAADSTTIPPNTHAHANWAFSAEGVYCLAFERSATLADGTDVSDQFTLVFAVGRVDIRSVDPAQCFNGGADRPTATDPAPGGALDQPDLGDGLPSLIRVPASQCVAGSTILSAGHIDYATRLVGGRLESLIGEDSSGTKQYREPSGTILWLKPSSRVTLPNGYAAVGPAGSTVWQAPQTQNRDLIWLGWSTEALRTSDVLGPVTWTIDRVDGPGRLRVYLSGAFGGVQQLVFDGSGSYQVPLGVHTHANWAFSAEGVYRVTMTQTAALADGQVSSDRETLTIVVGDVDPTTVAGSGSGCGPISEAALAAEAADQESSDQSPAVAVIVGSSAGQGRSVPTAGAEPPDPAAEPSAGDSVALLLSILGGLLLVGAASAGALGWRRRSRAKGGATA